MYVHSVKVPRLYKSAAKILQQIKENRASAKKLIFGAKHCNKKAICALVNQALRQFSVIDSLIENVQLLTNESRCDLWLARILITELLWGKKNLSDQSIPTKTILKYKSKLETSVLSLSDSSTSEKAKVFKPRVVRVNTIATSVEKIVNEFKNEDWKLVPFTGTSYEEFVSQTASLNIGEFMVDLHFKELLQFPHATEFHKHNLYKNGLLVLQDKASFLPTYLLNPEPGSTVLDMCAAPGMKTTHLAAMMNNQGSVYAVERNGKRFETLNTMVKKAGASCVKTIHQDVLKLTANECRNIKYILVDPSCSGSGMTDRTEYNQSTTPLKVRLEKLSGFQIVILKHALQNFPDAQRVVYSTCSIYSKENEFVIKEVLRNDLDFKLVNAQTLLNSSWKSNNSDENWSGITENCLCMKPEKDLTNGFFVAVFERTRESRRKTYKKRKVEAQKGNVNKKQKVRGTVPSVAQKRKTYNNKQFRSIKKGKYQKKQENDRESNKSAIKDSGIATSNTNEVVERQPLSTPHNKNKQIDEESGNDLIKDLINEQLKSIENMKSKKPKNISEQLEVTLPKKPETFEHKVTPMTDKSVQLRGIINFGTSSMRKNQKRSLSESFSM